MLSNILYVFLVVFVVLLLLRLFGIIAGSILFFGGPLGLILLILLILAVSSRGGV